MIEEIIFVVLPVVELLLPSVNFRNFWKSSTKSTRGTTEPNSYRCERDATWTQNRTT